MEAMRLLLYHVRPAVLLPKLLLESSPGDKDRLARLAPAPTHAPAHQGRSKGHFPTLIGASLALFFMTSAALANEGVFGEQNSLKKIPPDLFVEVDFFQGGGPDIYEGHCMSERDILLFKADPDERWHIAHADKEEKPQRHFEFWEPVHVEPCHPDIVEGLYREPDNGQDEKTTVLPPVPTDPAARLDYYSAMIRSQRQYAKEPIYKPVKVKIRRPDGSLFPDTLEDMNFYYGTSANITLHYQISM